MSELFRYEMALLVAIMSLTASLWKITDDDTMAGLLRYLNVLEGGVFLTMSGLWLYWLPGGITAYAGNDSELLAMVIHYLLIYLVVFAMLAAGAFIFWTPRAIKSRAQKP